MSDVVEKSIVILKASAESLGAAESFLRNRGWTLHSTHQLKEALLMLVQHQPKFMMISMDHPHPKTTKLPKVLKQAFPICVIACTEKTTSAAFNELNRSGTEYVIYPAVTGPAIERIVNRYYKDLQTKSANPTLTPTKTGSNQDGTISIRGNSSFGSSDITNILAMMNEGEFQAVQDGATLNMGRAQLTGSSADTMSSSNQGTLGTMMKSRRSPEDLRKDPRSTKMDSLLVRGATKTLDSSCNVTQAHPMEVGLTKNAACLVISSTRYSGYLLTVMKKETSIDEKFIKLIQERLLHFLKEHDDFKEAPSIELTITEVPFEDWALEHAEFLRKSVHEGKDVAVAFFPYKKLKIPVETKPGHPMAAISLNDLHGDEPVEFNLYLHLPKNDKYVLYTPRGGIFYETQKDRLNTQGVSQLHILHSDLVDLPKYQAQTHLNRKIKEFLDVDPEEGQS